MGARKLNTGRAAFAPISREHEPPKAKAARAIHGLRGIPPRINDPAGGGGGATASRLAAGYQPAVLKVISYGHGATRATAIGQYVQKDRRMLGRALR